MDPASFRRHGHDLVDWIAEYLEHSDQYPVLSRVKPGEIAAALPSHAPEESEPFDAIMADFERVLVPGLTHWNHPGFLAYFAITGSAPGVLADFPVGGPQSAGDVVAHVAGRDRARSGDARLAAAAHRPAGRLRGRDLRHRLDREHARACGRARGVDRGRSRARTRRARRPSAHSRVLLRSGALVDRQGGDDHRSRPRGVAQDRRGRRIPNARRCAARRDRRRPQGRPPADRRRRHRGHDVDDQRRPGAGNRRDLRAGAALAARRRGVRRRRGDASVACPHSRRRRPRRLACGQPAQVAVHAVRPERVLLPAHGRRARGVLADAGIPSIDGSRTSEKPDGHGHCSSDAGSDRSSSG